MAASSTINSETRGAHATTRVKVEEVAVKGVEVGAITTTTTGITIITKQALMTVGGVDTKTITKDAMVVRDITKISSKIFIIIPRL